MIRALLTGTLHADPESRTSKTGKPYCTARLKAETGDVARTAKTAPGSTASG